ncbi:MAG TPA: DUF6464 family protein [Coleofasciculaceae cyanobacterium]
MVVALFIFIVGLTPFFMSVWFMRQANARAQARLQLAIEAAANRGLASLRLPPEHQYVEGIGYMIGDFTCQFNARSSYIRCAVNPAGPCKDCFHYQPKD